MKRSEAQAFIESLLKLRAAATDPQAFEAPAVYPAWSAAGINYLEGQRVLYNNILYKVIISHISQEDWSPDAAPSLFTKVLIPDDSVIPAWEQPESTNPYKLGDKVSHNNKIWISITDNNIWEPGVYGWEEEV